MVKKTNPRWLIIGFPIVLVCVAAVVLIDRLNSQYDAKISFDTATVEVTVADTPSARAKGLSGYHFLEEDKGMWFVFDAPGYHEFHMKDMNFPIDIIWVSDNMGVVDITHRLSPDTYPDTVTSSRPARFVLEVQSGFAAKHGISVGDRVKVLEL